MFLIVLFFFDWRIWIKRRINWDNIYYKTYNKPYTSNRNWISNVYITFHLGIIRHWYSIGILLYTCSYLYIYICKHRYRQRNRHLVHVRSTKIRLNLSFSDWFGTKRKSINRLRPFDFWRGEPVPDKIS